MIASPWIPTERRMDLKKYEIIKIPEKNASKQNLFFFSSNQVTMAKCFVSNKKPKLSAHKYVLTDISGMISIY